MELVRVLSALGIVGETFELIVGGTVVALPASVLVSGDRVLKAIELENVGSIISVVYGKGSNFAPDNMTSNTEPAPYVASASEEDNGYKAFRAFEGAAWGWSTISTEAGWIEIDIGTAKSLYSYSVEGISFNGAPKAWKLYGSNDETSWDELDSQVDQIDWDDFEVREFTLDQSDMVDTYQYFKLDITEINGATYIYLVGICLYESVLTALTDIGAKLAFGVDPVVGAATLGHLIKDGDLPLYLVGSTLLTSMRCIGGATGVSNKLVITPFY